MNIPLFDADLLDRLDTELRLLGVGYVDRAWMQVVLVDSGTPLRSAVPPSSILTYQSRGLDHLAAMRPRIALARTLHYSDVDVTRLRTDYPAIMASRIMFVEAEPDPDAPYLDGIPQPRPDLHNEWLRAFNIATFEQCTAAGVKPIPCEAQFDDHPLKRRLTKLEGYFTTLRKDERYDPELKSMLVTILHLYLFIYRAWGIADCMGCWLLDPAVQELIGDLPARLPLVLGFGHGIQFEILYHYLRLDVFMAVQRRHLPPGTFGVADIDDRLFHERFAAQQLTMQVPLLDLKQAPFPY